MFASSNTDYGNCVANCKNLFCGNNAASWPASTAYMGGVAKCGGGSGGPGGVIIA